MAAFDAALEDEESDDWDAPDAPATQRSSTAEQKQQASLDSMREYEAVGRSNADNDDSDDDWDVQIQPSVGNDVAVKASGPTPFGVEPDSEDDDDWNVPLNGPLQRVSHLPARIGDPPRQGTISLEEFRGQSLGAMTPDELAAVVRQAGQQASPVGTEKAPASPPASAVPGKPRYTSSPPESLPSGTPLRRGQGTTENPTRDALSDHLVALRHAVPIPGEPVDERGGSIPHPSARYEKEVEADEARREPNASLDPRNNSNSKRKANHNGPSRPHHPHALPSTEQRPDEPRVAQAAADAGQQENRESPSDRVPWQEIWRDVDASLARGQVSPPGHRRAHSDMRRPEGKHMDGLKRSAASTAKKAQTSSSAKSGRVSRHRTVSSAPASRAGRSRSRRSGALRTLSGSRQLKPAKKSPFQRAGSSSSERRAMQRRHAVLASAAYRPVKRAGVQQRSPGVVASAPGSRLPSTRHGQQMASSRLPVHRGWTSTKGPVRPSPAQRELARDSRAMADSFADRMMALEPNRGAGAGQADDRSGDPMSGEELPLHGHGASRSLDVGHHQRGPFTLSETQMAAFEEVERFHNDWDAVWSDSDVPSLELKVRGDRPAPTAKSRKRRVRDPHSAGSKRRLPRETRSARSARSPSFSPAKERKKARPAGTTAARSRRPHSDGLSSGRGRSSPRGAAVAQRRAAGARDGDSAGPERRASKRRGSRSQPRKGGRHRSQSRGTDELEESRELASFHASFQARMVHELEAEVARLRAQLADEFHR